MPAPMPGFAHSLMETYPASAKVYMEMAEEEHQHRRALTELYQTKFGDFIPLIRRNEVLGLRQAQARLDHRQTQYRGDAPARRSDRAGELPLLQAGGGTLRRPAGEETADDLAEAEKGHESLAGGWATSM